QRLPRSEEMLLSDHLVQVGGPHARRERGLARQPLLQRRPEQILAHTLSLALWTFTDAIRVQTSTELRTWAAAPASPARAGAWGRSGWEPRSGDRRPTGSWGRR